jgi:hypothetical protein
MQKNIGDVYNNMDLTCDTFPSDDTVDPKAYLNAISTFQAGDVAIIFTPDDTHYEIAMACIEKGLHVMVTKPIVQTLEHHINLIKRRMYWCQWRYINGGIHSMPMHVIVQGVSWGTFSICMLICRNRSISWKRSRLGRGNHRIFHFI